MSPEKRLDVIVYGIVQGVGFRWWVRQEARWLGLTGYVRNRYDQTVEVAAEGTERDLRSLLSLLEQGPSAAVVDHVDVQWGPGSGKFIGFEVRY